MYIFLYIFYKAYRNMLYIFYIAYRNNKSIKVYIFYNNKKSEPITKFFGKHVLLQSKVLQFGFSHDIMSECNSFLHFLHLITFLLLAEGVVIGSIF